MKIAKILVLVAQIIMTAPAGGFLQAAPRFIVFPLEDLSGTPTLSWVGKGVAISVSDMLRLPGLSVVDLNERIYFVEASDLPPGATLSRASMITVARRAGADLVVMGSYSGTADNLRITVHVFNDKTLKLSGRIAANGPMSALPQMENELAWNILEGSGSSPGESRERFRVRTRKIPNSAFSYFIRSWDAPDRSKRINLLEKALALDENFPGAHFEAGRNYFEKRDCPSAVPHLELGRKPDSAYLRGDFMLGTCFLEQISLDDAIRNFSSLLAFARPPEALNNRGVAYLRKGDHLLAVQDLMEAHAISPADQTIGVNLVVLRLVQGDETAARSVLMDMLKLYPKNGMLQYLRGCVLRLSGDEKGAEAAFVAARNLGIDVDGLKSQSPVQWTRIFGAWNPHPTSMRY